MSRQMVLITHILHPAIVRGFLPAGLELGYEVTLVTDCGLAHKQYFVEQSQELPITILECDVFNPLAVIDLLSSHNLSPDMVFSNSDHLQTVTALVADYFSLPGKNWRRCYATKNKASMRNRLATLGLPTPRAELLLPGQNLPTQLSYPVVAKPREGVASMNVRMCQHAEELTDYLKVFRRANPVTPVLLEEYMQGELFTLETLGDGHDMIAIGGFDVALSEPPDFIERSAVWNGKNSIQYREQALAQLRDFGVHFGGCHSEFIATESGPKLVEINYRSIGDGREFLLDELLPGGWFKPILQLHQGEPLPPFLEPKDQAIIRYLIAEQEGEVVEQTKEIQRQANGAIISYRPLKKLGESIRLSHSNKDYIGMVTAIANTSSDLHRTVEEFCSTLEWRIQA
ncbi:ATP-grasp domain-containing protein [Microbulbifer mangrovi]|uniref:ATP-grasp domain-containing protein n=1 Tax=Microbulbifer mangrovi TaxID=927787 RepID=UPI00195946CA|nr:ATP-grasp domain-containing protein [Microbulbifer mangrovi]